MIALHQQLAKAKKETNHAIRKCKNHQGWRYKISEGADCPGYHQFPRQDPG